VRQGPDNLSTGCSCERVDLSESFHPQRPRVVEVIDVLAAGRTRFCFLGAEGRQTFLPPKLAQLCGWRHALLHVAGGRAQINRLDLQDRPKLPSLRQAMAGPLTNHYAVLGLPFRGSTRDDIKRAYRTKVLQYHPDKGGDPQKFVEVQESYDVLKDAEKRQAFRNIWQFWYEAEAAAEAVAEAAAKAAAETAADEAALEALVAAATEAEATAAKVAAAQNADRIRLLFWSFAAVLICCSFAVVWHTLASTHVATSALAALFQLVPLAPAHGLPSRRRTAPTHGSPSQHWKAQKKNAPDESVAECAIEGAQNKKDGAHTEKAEAQKKKNDKWAAKVEKQAKKDAVESIRAEAQQKNHAKLEAQKKEDDEWAVKVEAQKTKDAAEAEARKRKDVTAAAQKKKDDKWAVKLERQSNKDAAESARAQMQMRNHVKAEAQKKEDDKWNTQVEAQKNKDAAESAKAEAQKRKDATAAAQKKTDDKWAAKVQAHTNKDAAESARVKAQSRQYATKKAQDAKTAAEIKNTLNTKLHEVKDTVIQVAATTLLGASFVIGAIILG